MTVVDRTDPAWQRIRANCCDIAAPSEDLDAQTDRVFAVTHRRAVEKPGLSRRAHNAEIPGSNPGGATSLRLPGS